MSLWQRLVRLRSEERGYIVLPHVATGDLATAALHNDLLDDVAVLKTSVNDDGTLVTANVITPTLASDQNDWAPGLVSGAHNLIRCNNSADRIITGIDSTNIASGTLVTLVPINSGDLFFPHQSGSSSAAHRFTNGVTSGSTPVAAGGRITYWFDATTATWRLLKHTQGAKISYGASSSQSGWSASGLAIEVEYVLEGTRLSVWAYISGTSNGTAASFTVPFTSTTPNPLQTVGPLKWEDNGSVGSVMGMLFNAANAATISAYMELTATTPWTNTGTKVIAGQIHLTVQ